MKRPTPKTDVVFDYVAIKAETSDLTRERARRADFNDEDRSILSWASSASVRAAQETPRGRQAPQASQARSSNTGGAACRQPTIATRKRAVRFGAAPIIDRGTELRAQERTELLPAERLL